MVECTFKFAKFAYTKSLASEHNGALLAIWHLLKILRRTESMRGHFLGMVETCNVTRRRSLGRLRLGLGLWGCSRGMIWSRLTRMERRA